MLREIVGMNVIDVRVVLDGERGRAAAQTLERQPVRSVDARCAHDRHAHAASRAPRSQPRFRIGAALCALGLWTQRTRLRDELAAAVAVHARSC